MQKSVFPQPVSSRARVKWIPLPAAERFLGRAWGKSDKGAGRIRTDVEGCANLPLSPRVRRRLYLQQDGTLSAKTGQQTIDHVLNAIDGLKTPTDWHPVATVTVVRIEFEAHGDKHRSPFSESTGLHHWCRSLCDVAVDGADLPLGAQSFGAADWGARTDMEYWRVHSLRSL